MPTDDGRVLLALLICTDGDCDLHFEAIGSLEELDWLVCESCGCLLQAIAWAEHLPNGRTRTHVQAGVQIPVQAQEVNPV